MISLVIFRPNIYLNSFKEIDLQELVKRNIKAIFMDLDNTLVSPFQKTADDDVKTFIQNCHQLDLTVIVISNNTEERVSLFCKELGIDYYAMALKPLNKGFKKALQELNLTTKEVCMIGDQVMTDVLGGNLMGFMTILLVPIVEKDLVITKFNRAIEKVILKVLRLKKGVIYE